VQNGHVRAADHTETAAHGRAFDHGNHRLRQAVQAREHFAKVAIRRDEWISAGGGNRRHVGHRAEVAAGAERAARTAQYQGACLAIRADALDRIADLAHHVVV
jgi:hypothetical protein